VDTRTNRRPQLDTDVGQVRLAAMARLPEGENGTRYSSRYSELEQEGENLAND
jgi:hypothetical protein